MQQVPTDLRAVRNEGVLRVTWPETVCDFPFAFLRCQCTCAHCVNEWTGERILDPSSVPDDIDLQSMELVGNYAVRIHWSDGHNAGLYTWERLRELEQLL